MADDKLKTGPEPPGPDRPGDAPVKDALPIQEPPVQETDAPGKTQEPAAPGTGPALQAEQSVIPGMGEDNPARSALGEVVVDFDKINELMSQRRAAAHGAVDKLKAPATDKDGKEAPILEEKAPEADQPKKRRGRPPKEQAGVSAGKKEKAAEPRTGRPSKVDKAAREEAPPSVRDKVSRGDKDGLTPAQRGGKTRKERNQNVRDFLDGKRTSPFPSGKPLVKEAAAPPPEINLPPTPDVPPRPVEEGKIVYLKMAELHPFHTFREHPYKVQDDKAMDDLVGTIKEHGIMTPATVRPEKDGKGYEIIAGHRRHHGGTRAGLEEMPCIVREMTDLEAVREMRNSNKQRGDPLPSELAKLLDLEVEAIKRQGARPKNEKEAEALGKLSVEIVGKEHDMNYKKVMRYIRLNSLVPELLDKVDTKQMGFMPAVEISYIRPENQRLIAVSIDGEQSSPSVAQAKRLHELDKEGKLNGDVIDGILSEEKKEDRGVIISTAELSKYFGKEVTPAKMKEQIMALLDEWKEKQPPELAQPDRKKDLEK